jgi:hypothetical protein
LAIQEEQQEKQRGPDHHRGVELEQLQLHAHRADQCREPEDDADVEDVRADGIPDGDGALPFGSGHRTDDQLGRAGAIGDHGQPDQQGRYPEPNSQRGAAADEPFGAKIEGRQTRQKHQRDDHGLRAD